MGHIWEYPISALSVPFLVWGYAYAKPLLEAVAFFRNAQIGARTKAIL